MKIYIITYKESTTIDECVARYKELGYNPIIFMGKSIKKDNIPYNHVMFINYLDLFNSLNYDDDICISEDDVYLKEKIIIKDKNQINWLGYWNITKTFIMGSMLLYYPTPICLEIKHQSVILEEYTKGKETIRTHKYIK